MGGDADTTGAITGALANATVGANGIPQEWLDGLWEWPRSVNWIRRLAERFDKATAKMPEETETLPLFWPGILPRNVFFLIVVLLQGLCRLLPPY